MTRISISGEPSETPTLPDTLPTGSIVAFAADDITQLPNLNWHVCNGEQFTASEYPDLFAMIGYANGGRGEQFYIPDLRGQFIRGTGNGVPPAGTIMAATTANPGFSLNLSYMPTACNLTNLGAFGPAAKKMRDWNSGSNQFPISGGDNETRPVNMYFHYIIKTKPGAAIPTGSVVPYTGSDDNIPTTPTPLTWVECNGDHYNAKAHQAVFKVIGSRFTDGGGSSQFQVPNLSGLFIRGVDTGSGRDPDADHRNAAPDRTKGRHVGTLQASATSAAGFSVNIPHFPSGGNFEVYATIGKENLRAGDHILDSSFSGGAVETRPKNVAVKYYMHFGPSFSTGEGKVGDNFPIGGLIAIPGNAAPDANYWIEANGASVQKKGKFASLWDIMTLEDPAGTAWGTEDDNSFRLPNLSGQFLRATDIRNNIGNWGDPERFKRSKSGSGGTSRGTGSAQADATGSPRNPFSVTVKYPKDTVANAATLVGHSTSSFNNKQQSFPLQGPKANETAPACVAVRFFVKYASAS